MDKGFHEFCKEIHLAVWGAGKNGKEVPPARYRTQIIWSCFFLCVPCVFARPCTKKPRQAAKDAVKK